MDNATKSCLVFLVAAILAFGGAMVYTDLSNYQKEPTEVPFNGPEFKPRSVVTTDPEPYTFVHDVKVTTLIDSKGDINRVITVDLEGSIREEDQLTPEEYWDIATFLGGYALELGYNPFNTEENDYF